MKNIVPLLLLALLAAIPLRAQDAANLTIAPPACPVDRRDGPLYADGRAYYGIPALRIVQGFLAPPHDSFGRRQSGTQNVRSSALRLLTDDTDYEACMGLTRALTNGARSGPAPEPWVYFAADGFYFVSSWKPAQALSNYTTSYGHVMVYDGNYTLLGAYAF
jgi:hypothetical protein